MSRGIPVEIPMEFFVRNLAQLADMKSLGRVMAQWDAAEAAYDNAVGLLRSVEEEVLLMCGWAKCPNGLWEHRLAGRAEASTEDALGLIRELVSMLPKVEVVG